jgi:hypothetical protein
VTARKKDAAPVVGPGQDLFIKDEHLPPGSTVAGPAASAGAGPAPRHVYVVLTAGPDGATTPVAAFKTAAAADAAARQQPDSGASVDAVRLFATAQEWLER